MPMINHQSLWQDNREFYRARAPRIAIAKISRRFYLKRETLSPRRISSHLKGSGQPSGSLRQTALFNSFDRSPDLWQGQFVIKEIAPELIPLKLLARKKKIRWIKCDRVGILGGPKRRKIDLVNRISYDLPTHLSRLMKKTAERLYIRRFLRG